MDIVYAWLIVLSIWSALLLGFSLFDSSRFTDFERRLAAIERNSRNMP